MWIDKPVREWDYPIDTLPEIAQFLARSVREVLGDDPAAGYTVHVFNNRSDGHPRDIDEPEPPQGQIVEKLTTIGTNRSTVLTLQ